VYRTLDFLLEQGFIHRLASLNAFIGCFHPERNHVGQFFICEQCGNVAEFDSADLKHCLQQSASAAQFTIKQQTIELFGCCQQCQKEPA
jgi:Fur family zinc uptake transcriptional regulator